MPELKLFVAKWAIVVFLTVATTLASAYQTAYKCVVKESKMLKDDGFLEEFDYYKGKEFIVDKATGRMNGGVTNHNANTAPNVIDPGGDQQAYKVITTFGPYTSVAYLYVAEFTEGYEKPFMHRKDGNLLSGTCEPY